MKYIKTFLFVLAIPFFLVQMKIEHSKMERENRKKIIQNGREHHDLFVTMDSERKRKLN